MCQATKKRDRIDRVGCFVRSLILFDFSNTIHIFGFIVKHLV